MEEMNMQDMNLSNLRNIVNNNMTCPPTPTTIPTPGMDENERYLANYRTFQDLNSKGIDLNALLSRIDSLEKQVKGMEQPKDVVDHELFGVMAEATGDCESVRSAKARLSDIEHAIIAEICAKDARFVQAYDEYRKVVYAEYSKMVKGVRSQ